MSSSSSATSKLEIAHVLFMDVVGFSKLPMDKQKQVIEELQQVVITTPEYASAMAQMELVSLPTGDGMALGFFGGPEAPVQCAMNIAVALRDHPEILLRMGVHSGPVYRVRDIKDNINISGGGINYAQRVMDCGDAGHILLSAAVAEVLVQHSSWEPHIYDLGVAEVKHGVKIHIYNLYTDVVGNREIPERVTRVGDQSTGQRAKPPTPTAQSGPPLAAVVSVGPRKMTVPTVVDTSTVKRMPVPRATVSKETAGSAVLGFSAATAGVTSGRSTQSLKIALLYKRGAEPDETLLGALEAELRADGNQVFIDRHMSIGVEWAREIEHQVRTADAVIPLLSAASIHSEMLAYELQIAHDAAQQNNGKPRILPVRVQYETPFPEPIGGIVNSLQYAMWTGKQDEQALIAHLIQSLHDPIDKPIQPAGKLEAVGGAVPLDSQFYIVRPTDDDFFRAIARHDSIVLVKGARQMGKTSLLARGLQQARGGEARVVLTDLQKFNADQLKSIDSFFVTMVDLIADQLDLDFDPQKISNPRRGASMNFERFIRREVLAPTDSYLVWALDEVDRLFSCPYGSEVFGLFRSWHNERSLDPSGPWQRLTLAIAYATEAHLFISDLNQSPFNVGTRLALSDFTLDQVAELNRRYGSPLQSPSEIGHFHQLLCGQPYLVRRGLNDMVNYGITLAVFERQADRDEGMFGDHLRRILVLLAQDAHLCDSLRAFISDATPLPQEYFYRLRAGGVITGDSPQDVKFRCQLYQNYLTHHLLS
jgi:hypothetical protein